MQRVPPHTQRLEDREREREGMSSRPRGSRPAWGRTDLFWSRKKTTASPGVGVETAAELEEGRGRLPALPSGAPRLRGDTALPPEDPQTNGRREGNELCEAPTLHQGQPRGTQRVTSCGVSGAACPSPRASLVRVVP